MYQNSHKIINLIFVIALLFLVACSMTTTTTNIRTGTDGLKVNVLKTLPNEIMENQNFQIDLELENNGASDITNAMILASGYDTDLLYLQQNIIKGINLKGKSIYTPYGEKTLKSFSAETKKISPQIQKDDTKVILNYCYQYSTIATADVCINPNIYSTSALKEVCKPKTISLSNQGAPVAVKRIEQNFFLNGQEVIAEFKIYISNVNKGEVMAKDSYSKGCEGTSLKYEDVGVIDAEVYLSNKKIECTKQLKMKSSEDNFIICRVPINKEEGTYLTPMMINLTYGYISKEEIILKIKKMSVFSSDECFNKEDGTKCSDNYVCINQKCTDTPLCEYHFKDKGYSCMNKGDCDQSTIKTGFCPGGADFVCCKKNIFCDDKPDKTPCGLNMVCKNKKCISECEDNFGSQGYSCMDKTKCNQLTIKTGFCPGGANNVCCLAK